MFIIPDAQLSSNFSVVIPCHCSVTSSGLLASHWQNNGITVHICSELFCERNSWVYCLCVPVVLWVVFTCAWQRAWVVESMDQHNTLRMAVWDALLKELFKNFSLHFNVFGFFWSSHVVQNTTQFCSCAISSCVNFLKNEDMLKLLLALHEKGTLPVQLYLLIVTNTHWFAILKNLCHVLYLLLDESW